VAVGVATGHYTREQLEEAGADIVLNTLRDPFPGID
jgi:phosphoglycolate phosphatase-like HAD superfamily hydrolase